MNHWFAVAGLEQLPNKTFIGRFSRGFDWLGYRFEKNALCGITVQSVGRFAVKHRRLLEQARRRKVSNDTRQQVAEYIRRWRLNSAYGKFDCACQCNGTMRFDTRIY